VPATVTTSAIELDRRLSVAPMLDWTDRHCRHFHRQLAPDALLYTEMVTTGALLHGDRDSHLRGHPEQGPVALQLGGSDPVALAQCAKMASDYGYSEVNLNVGCPSERVQNGAFGACLMKEPALVADCVAAMRAATPLAVTVKHRIGVDDCDSYQQLAAFVDCVAAAGCEHFIVHARKAWLQGLSPKQNREIPPLDYPMVAALKADFPALGFTLNGGIATVAAALTALESFDGVMIGREVYANPYLLAQLAAPLYQRPLPTRRQVVESMAGYIEQELAAGNRLHHITRHMLGLYRELPGARQFRRHLSENCYRDDATLDILWQALEFIPGDL